MFKKLGTAWKSATDFFKEKHTYIVYAPRKDQYAGFKLKEDYSDRMIHRAIAHRENNHSQRESAGKIMPGSFNFVRVRDCVDFEQAVSRAKAIGLKYEPLKLVLSRHLNIEKEREASNTLSAADLAEIEKLKKLIDGFCPPKTPGMP